MFHGVGIMSRTYPLLPAAGERTGRRLACLGASESWDRLGGLPRALWGVVLGEGAGQVAGTYFRRHRVTHETAVFLGGGEGKMRFPVVAMALAIVALGGCAGRSPAPVSVVQAQDRYMDCPAILIEVQANNQRLQGLASEEGWKTAQNVGAGVAGLFIWPLWFGMDFQGTAGKEAAAILAVLAEQRRCGEPEQ